MKHNAKEMEQARLEAIKILDENPNCTERDFKHIREVLEDDTINVRPLTTKPLNVSAMFSQGTSLTHIWSCVDDNGIIRVGSINDLARQFNVSYNLIYNATRGIASSSRLKTNLIDFIPLKYSNSMIEVVNYDGDIISTLTYGETCVKFNVHTSDLWQLIETGQIHHNYEFRLGVNYV